MKNTGRPYESLVENLFGQLLQQEQVKNLEIEKNKILDGKSGSHEIDIYWCFELGGIKYQTLIQAKDWKTTVPQGELLKFKGVLDDIPGQPRGVFVAKTGYQKGAIGIAKANGILLYEFREPTDVDTKDWLKTVHIGGKIFVPSCKPEFQYDDDWVRGEMKVLGLKNFDIQFQAMEDEFFLYNLDGSVFESIHSISERAKKDLGHEIVAERVVDLDYSDKFIESGNALIPRIKLKNLRLKLTQSVIENNIVVNIPPFVGFILKNTIDGSEKLYSPELELK